MLKQSSRGFTLVEMLVATALFTVVTGSMVSLYLYSIKISRRADVIRTAAQNARFLSEYLAKEIRNGSIDYAPVSSICTGSPTQGLASLAIVNISGQHLCIYRADAAVGNNDAAYDANGLYLDVKLNTEPSQLLTSNLKISAFSVYLNPLVDPTGGNQHEETVTIIGAVNAVSGDINTTSPQDSVVIPIDVSISIPDYGYSGA